MEINPSEIPPQSLNKLLLGSVVPRPIAWVSTLSDQGQPNLAPFSFFNVVCYNPPTLLFCPGVRSLDGSRKDTYYNIRATGEYVINIVSEALAEKMNITSTDLPSGVNEFELAGLTPAPSVKVKPPRVAESPVNFECELRQIVDIGDGGVGSGWIVIGEVVHLHMADEVMLPDFKVNIHALKPIARLSGPQYTRIGEVFEMKRPTAQLPAKQS